MAVAAGKLIHVGALKGPHGLKGQVKANIKLDDFDLLIEAGPLLTDGERTFKVLKWNPVGQGLLALTLDGVTSIEQAEKLRGILVYLDRSKWPEDEDAVYLDSLIGSDVTGPDGVVAGVVRAVVELPAGPALEVTMMLKEGTEIKVLPLVEEFVELGDGVVLTELGVAILAI